MFEFSIAKKYLIPKRRHLSVSLISLLSVVVISLVVWLVLVFLSVTEGIEKTWLKKLTALNAPVRVTPTEKYYNSYYYLVDSISSASNYSLKSISEKLHADNTDPYEPDLDIEPPKTWQKPLLTTEGNMIDLVKGVSNSIGSMGNNLFYSDFEISGALMRLRLVRGRDQSFLTQVSYLNSFSEKNPQLHAHFVEPSWNEIQPLFSSLTAKFDSIEDQPGMGEPVSLENMRERMHRLFDHIQLSEVTLYALPTSAMKVGSSLKARKSGTQYLIDKQGLGTIHIGEDRIEYIDEYNEITDVSYSPLLLQDGMSLPAKLLPETIDNAHSPAEIGIKIYGNIQDCPISGNLNLRNVQVHSATLINRFTQVPTYAPYWTYFVDEKAYLPEDTNGDSSIMLPKQFRDSGVMIGDSGYFSYGNSSGSTFQEQRMPVIVSGFYDPGVMAIGARYILAPSDLIHHINASGNFFSLDQHMNSGIGIWLNDLSKANAVKSELEQSLTKSGLSPYWKVTTFKEYDFAKDLMQQFQSDKYLFTLIGVIILIVACCNIISLLTLLVNDKKQEIGIMGAMGAKPSSIALIFALCGAFLGLISCGIGAFAAQITMSHIDGVASLLSFFQGHEAFNQAFYGNGLPSELSTEALTFILIATPIIAVLAGLVPAIKACRLTPSQILRSE